jgi:2-amino-4-hydroxy-6-hydroxymethyldihydropteridine diphosphokinase
MTLNVSPPRATTAFIALGANLGDRTGSIHRAIELLSKTGGIKLIRLSPLIETAAVGGPADSPAYLNAAAEIFTLLSPRVLLDQLLAVEAELGRVRRHKWEPRVIDLDLLLYGDAMLDEPGLAVPHPRMHERRFVLEPLSQIAPNLVHPKLGKTIQALLDELPAEP